ncbi:MAG: hypothetical protein HOP29_16030 [Phycisphaerales bacterium]|nr:hypothetical protein [Phycisphaerales bacterium]
MSATILGCIFGPIQENGPAYLIHTVRGVEKRVPLSQLCTVFVHANNLAHECQSRYLSYLPLAEALKDPELDTKKAEAKQTWERFCQLVEDALAAFEPLADALDANGMGERVIDLRVLVDSFVGDLIRFAGYRMTVHPIPAPNEPEIGPLIVELRKAEMALAERLAQPKREAQESLSTNFCFRMEGEKWVIRFGGESGYFGNLKGFAIIAELIRTTPSSRAISAIELMGSDPARVDQGGDSQTAADREGLARLERRRVEADADLDRALSENDLAEVAQLEIERDAIRKSIAEAVGPAGRLRKLVESCSPVKARNAVWNSLTRVYKRLEKGGLGQLATHLRNSIKREGDAFAYRPDREILWEFVKKIA